MDVIKGMSLTSGFEHIQTRLSAACKAFKKWAFIIFMLLGPFGWALEAQGGESFDLAPFNNEQLQAYRPPKPGEPFVFAIPNFVSLTPWNSGLWHELEEGFLLWSLKINAPGALSLSFGFGRFRLPAGASLVIRRPDQEVILGPFTDKENTHHGQLWTALLPGWQAELELRIPRNMSNHLELELTSINRGFRALPPKLGNWKEHDLLFSPTYQPGECNLDVACPEAESWSDEIRSVGLVTVGSMACSGTLLNNTSQDLTPYFLTAEHCGITPANAQSVVVYWNYQKSLCGGTRDGNLSQFTQGSFFRAAWSAQEGSDFALVELASRPQPSFFPHWSGWDRRSILPQGAVAIHHPQGAEKMISFDLDPLDLASSSDALPVRDPSMYLKVQAWDLGTTEPGSSGCGLWSMEHRLVGQLWGGSASCSFPQGSDYFGRLWASWEGGGTTFTRLKDHLDPLQTTQEVLEGRDWCFPPQVDFQISPNPAAMGEEVVFTSQVFSGVPPYTYSWDLDGDGFPDCDSPQCVFTYSRAYDGNVTLLVQDSQPCPAVASHALTVVDPEQGVRLVSPVAGDVVPSGSSFMVRWFAPQNAVRFKLLYSTDGGRRWHLITDKATGSSHQWNVPTPTQNKNRSLFKIMAYDSQDRKLGSDRSDGFFTLAVMQLTTLKGGEVLRSGEPYPVAWITHQTIRPVESVELFLSVNNKITWKKLAKLSGNPGSYTITVPPVGKTKPNCWIKVLLLDSRGERVGADTTDNPFTVIP